MTSDGGDGRDAQRRAGGSDAARPARRAWPMILVFWTMLGLLESTAAYVRMLGSGRARRAPGCA